MRYLTLAVICIVLLGSGIACERSSTSSGETTSSAPLSTPGASPRQSAEPAATDSKAEEILRDTQAVYAAAKTYRDFGVETNYHIKPSAEMTVTAERHFETRILAPTTFRFEIRESAATNGADIYWNGGEPEGKAKRYAASTKTVYDAPAEYVMPTNYEVVTVVPRMMLPFLLIGFSKPVTQMKNALLEGEEMIDGHSCWVVTGENGGSEKSLWIDQQTHLIRKMRRRSLKRHITDESAPRSETIITYKPELNASLADEDLRFVPPAK